MAKRSARPRFRGGGGGFRGGSFRFSGGGVRGGGGSFGGSSSGSTSQRLGGSSRGSLGSPLSWLLLVGTVVVYIAVAIIER